MNGPCDKRGPYVSPWAQAERYHRALEDGYHLGASSKVSEILCLAELVDTLEAENARLRDWVKEMAQQKTNAELEDEGLGSGEDDADEIIKIVREEARSLLEKEA